MTGKQFLKKLDAVRPGTWIPYYLGYLHAERQLDKAVDALARAVWGAQRDGLVALVQQRVDGKSCRYIAVKL